MTILLNSLKERKYKIQVSLFFFIILAIYFTLDYLNMSYREMILNYGITLVITNIFLNIIMSFLSSLLIVSSELLIKGNRAGNLGLFSIIFGMFTYGCTTCMIALLANFGIMFSVFALPFAGLPYKLISLVLIVLGIYITNRQMRKGCKVTFKDTKEDE